MIIIDTLSMIFTMGEDINNNHNQRILISVSKRNRGGQGMIEIISTGDGGYDDGHYVYLWYDEGKFPSEFDLVEYPPDSMQMRLRVIGVDEI